MSDRDRCTEPMIRREDGSWYCPKCGHETSIKTKPTRSRLATLEAENARLAALVERLPQWSADPPTVAGWYWFKRFPKWAAEIKRIEVDETCGLLMDGWHPRHTVTETKGKCRWAGPIQEPPSAINSPNPEHRPGEPKV